MGAKKVTITMYVKESTKNMVFWFCGAFFGAYWQTNSSFTSALVYIITFAVILALIDCFVHTTKKPTKRLIPPTNE